TIETRKLRKEYLTYPLRTITDFKHEIDTVRENYYNCKDVDKNRLHFVQRGLQTEFPAKDQLAKIGKIYYGVLLQADDKRVGDPEYDPILPATVIFSTDEFFDTNPFDLVKIAECHFNSLGASVTQIEFSPRNNRMVSTQLTNNKAVYITMLMIPRIHLPKDNLQGRLIPVLAAPNITESALIVDCKFWTKDLIANFMQGEI
ncbi:MAG: hypothetical protein LBE09_06580, partial [Christensenellaceae bacterium]|nr:hypothetical protein [Christensenellaceae bacterium]